MANSIGDVVYLNSGGPPMTVMGVDPSGNLQVAWTNGSQFLQQTIPVHNQDPDPVWLPWIRSRFLQTLAAAWTCLTNR